VAVWEVLVSGLLPGARWSEAVSADLMKEFAASAKKLKS
jgi:hypothetical protein